MTFYIVILYDGSGAEIYNKNWLDYTAAKTFLFNAQFDWKGAAAGKILQVSELGGVRVFEKILDFGMWTPVDDQELVSQYMKIRKG